MSAEVATGWKWPASKWRVKALATRRGFVQPQLIPHMAGQPAGAPLPRPVQPQTAQPDMHHIAVQCRCQSILGEQRDLPGLLAAFVKCLNRPAPRGALAVIDLAKIQHMPLHRPPARHPAVLHDAPVAVFLPVLPANLVAQKRARRLPNPAAVSQETWSAPQAVLAVCRRRILGFSRIYRGREDTKFPKPGCTCERRVNPRMIACREASHLQVTART